MAKVVNVIYKVDDKALLKAKSEIQGIEKETKDSEKEMLKLDKAIQKTGKDGGKSFLNFKNIIGTISVAYLASQLISLGRTIFDLGVKQEQLNIAFTTFLGSAQKAKVLLGDLTKFAIVTPFTPDQVNNAAKALLAFGVQGKEIIPTLKMIGDVSSGTGKDLTEMAIIFGQIRSTGRLMGQDLLQLINAGFNPLQIISEKTGKSVAKLKDEMEKGNISFQMVSDAFKTATSEGGLFFNLMEKQSVSIGGKLSTVAGNIEEIFKNIFTATSGPLADFVDKLATISEAFLKMSKTSAQARDEIINAVTSEEIAKFDEFSKKYKDKTKALEDYKSELKRTSDFINAEYAFTVQRMLDNEITLKDRITGNVQAKEQLHIKLNETRQRLGAEAEAYRNLIPVLEKFIVDSELAAKATKKEGDEHKKTKKEIDERAKALAAINKQLGFQTAAQKVTQAEADAKKQEQIDKEANDRSNENFDRQQEYRKEKLRQAKEEEYEILEQAAERQRMLEQAITDFAIDSIQQVLYASLLSDQEDFSSQREKFDQELELAGDNERAKDQIRRREEEAEKAFRQRQKEAEKQNALKKIAIDTAINVIRSIANNGGIPLGLPFGALAAAAGLVQAATVRKLAKGEVGIDGPGTKTSDSIPAMLSVGESVINADATKRSSRLLEAINDRKIDDSILYKIASNGGRQATIFDDSRIVDAINKNRVDYDTHGYTIMKGIEKGRNFKMYVRSKIQGYK